MLGSQGIWCYLYHYYLSVTVRTIDADTIIGVSFTISLAISGIISFIIGLKLWDNLRSGGLY